MLVVRTARFSEPGYFRPRFGASLSPDGSLVALWGPELKLVATADGSVRAQYGGCVAGAAFAPDGRSLVLLGCAEEPAKSDVVGDATKSVYRWDLPTDSVRDLGSGPYETVELTTDGTRIIAIGSHDARVLSASDGTVVHAFKIDESGSYSGGERRGAGVLRRLVEESPLRG